jgi:hypothetical protein
MQSKKRGQITLFIVLGVVLVIGISMFFYLRSTIELTPEAQQARREKALAEVPTEFMPIVEYVENCISQIGEKGVVQLGMYGGFLELPSSSFVSISNQPTESDVAPFVKGSSWKVPYYWYLKSSNLCTGTCEFKSVPESRLFLNERDATGSSSVSIEEQINDYILENIDSCLKDFEVFEAQGFDITQDIAKRKIDTTILDRNVLLSMEMPVIVEKDGVDKKLNDFFIELPVDLKGLYELAKSITQLEAEQRFLERNFLSVIVGYSGIDTNKLPPMSATEISPKGGEMWIKSEVKKLIEGALNSHVSLLQVFDTYNYRERFFPGNDLANTLYQQGTLIATEPSYPNLRAGFEYVNWPIFFDLDCDGELCRPDSITSNLAAIIGVQKYNFVYDLSYPVKVTLEDPFAFNDRGYTFQFFLESNIRGNQPMPADYDPILFDFPDSDTMLCNENNKNSGEITIGVSDSESLAILDGVSLSYACMDESCIMGETSSLGVFESKFPVCIGGVVSLLKVGYLGKGYQMDTYLDESSTVNIELEPFREKEIIIKKKVLQKDSESNWIFSGVSRSLYYNEGILNEQAIITLTRKGEPGDESYATVLEYDHTNSSNNMVRLIPGTYDASIILLLFDSDKIKINESVCGGVEAFGICFGDTSYLSMEFNETTPYSSGGLELEVDISKSDLDSSDEIVFYAVSPDLRAVNEEDRSMDDVGEMGRIREYSETYATSLKPLFS